VVCFRPPPVEASRLGGGGQSPPPAPSKPLVTFRATARGGLGLGFGLGRTCVPLENTTVLSPVANHRSVFPSACFTCDTIQYGFQLGFN
jgi:hypothetical protein